MKAAITPNSGRPVDTDLTARVLAAAVEMVVEVGYDGLRVEAVAKRAGCGKAAIYRRYTDKADLVAAAILSVMVQGEVPDTGSLEGDLLAHALQNRDNQEQPRLARGHALGLVAVIDPAVFPKVSDRLFQARHEQGVQLLRRGIDRGELPRTTDVGLLVDTIAGLTLLRVSVKRMGVDAEQYRAVIHALITNPPLISDSAAQTR